jgi:hypothetical protein
LALLYIQNTTSFWEIWFLWKAQFFFAENWRKSKKIVIITTTPISIIFENETMTEMYENIYTTLGIWRLPTVAWWHVDVLCILCLRIKYIALIPKIWIWKETRMLRRCSKGAEEEGDYLSPENLLRTSSKTISPDWIGKEKWKNALAAWRIGHRIRLRSKKTRVWIPLGYTVFREIIASLLCVID